jgi:hypothetical protein
MSCEHVWVWPESSHQALEDGLLALDCYYCNALWLIDVDRFGSCKHREIELIFILSNEDKVETCERCVDCKKFL